MSDRPPRFWHRLDPRRSLRNGSCLLFVIAPIVLIGDIHVVVVRPGGMIAIPPTGIAIIAVLLGLMFMGMEDSNRQEQALINTLDYRATSLASSGELDDDNSAET